MVRGFWLLICIGVKTEESGGQGIGARLKELGLMRLKALRLKGCN